MRMGRWRVLQVGNGVAGDAVGTALQQDELGRMRIHKGLRPVPGGEKSLIPGLHVHGQVEFHAPARPAAGLLRSSRAGVEVATILVQIGKYQFGIILEGIEHAITVMRIDIDIGHAMQAMHRTQGFDRHTAVVEHAKARGTVPAGMMQTGDGDKGAPALARHQPVNGIQHAAHDKGGGLIDTRKGRGVPQVQIAGAGGGLADDPLDIPGGVESLDARPVGHDRRVYRDPRLQTGGTCRRPEDAHTVRTEGVALAKAVAGQFFADVHAGLVHAPSLARRGRRDSQTLPVSRARLFIKVIYIFLI